MRPLQNSKGTTLVELMVSITLLTILSLAAISLLAPCARAYITVQQQSRAQTLADALVENLRLELESAVGEMRFAEASETDSNMVYETLVSAETPRPAQGTALEYSVFPNHVVMLDAGAVSELRKQISETDTKTILSATDALKKQGYLHMRYFRDSQTVTEAKNGFAYAYTDIYAKGAYMNMKIGNIAFYARGWEQNNDQTVTRLTSLTVVITIVSEKDQTVLCTQKAIIPLPGKPVYSAGPLLKDATE